MTLTGSFQLRTFYDSMSPVSTSSEPSSAQPQRAPLLLTLKKAKLQLSFVILKATESPGRNCCHVHNYTDPFTEGSRCTVRQLLWFILAVNKPAVLLEL